MVCFNFGKNQTNSLERVRKSTGLLISNNWKYSTYSPLCNNHSLESHAITVTAPVKLHVVVIYRPSGHLGTFLEELGMACCPHSPRMAAHIVFW